MHPDKANQMILCVPKTLVNSRHGIRIDKIGPVHETFSQWGRYASFQCRGNVESEPTEFLQVATYCVVSNIEGKILAYRRPSKEADPRLGGKRSIGIGGHVEAEDWPGEWKHVSGEKRFLESIASGANRELFEEAGLIGTPVPISLIYDTGNEVGRVHLGVLFVVSTGFPVKESPEILDPQFLQVDEIAAFEDLEGWSRIVIDAIRDGLLDISGINTEKSSFPY